MFNLYYLYANTGGTRAAKGRAGGFAQEFNYLRWFAGGRGLGTWVKMNPKLQG